MIEPSAEYLDSYIEAYDENAVAGITAHRFRDARKEDVLARFDAYAHERDLPPNRVGAHFYWLVDDARGRFLGEISVRHRLTEALRALCRSHRLRRARIRAGARAMAR